MIGKSRIVLPVVQFAKTNIKLNENWWTDNNVEK